MPKAALAGIGRRRQQGGRVTRLLVRSLAADPFGDQRLQILLIAHPSPPGATYGLDLGHRTGQGMAGVVAGHPAASVTTPALLRHAQGNATLGDAFAAGAAARASRPLASYMGPPALSLLRHATAAARMGQPIRSNEQTRRLGDRYG